MRRSSLALLFLAAAMMAGPLACQTWTRFSRYVDDQDTNALTSHRSWPVMIAADTGSALGIVASLPIGIPWAFVHGMISEYDDLKRGQTTDDARDPWKRNVTEDQKYAAQAPMILGEAVGQHALGVPAWLAFGWWWPHPAPDERTIAQVARAENVPKPAGPARPAIPASITSATLPSPVTPDQPVMVYGGGSVGALAFSPDGKTCAVGRGKFLLLIDAADGRCYDILAGHDGMVANAVFTRDGSRIVTSSFDRPVGYDDQLTSYSKARKPDFTARLWDLATGRCLQVFTGHTNSIVGLAVSADGSRVVTGSDDGTARLWDAATGQSLFTLTGHDGGVGSAAISPDGKLILTGSADKTARLWDASNGRLLQTLTGHAAPVYSVAFSPDGRRVLTGSPDRTSRVWDAATGKELFKMTGGSRTRSRVRTGGDAFFGPLPPTNMVLNAVYTADGSKILTGVSSGAAVVWNADNGKRIGEIPSVAQEGATRRKNPGICRVVAFSRDGSRVMTGAMDGLVRLWDSTTGKCLLTLGGHGDNEIRSFALSPDGAHFAIGTFYCSTVLWSIPAGYCLRTMRFINRGPGWDVSGLAFSRGGEQLFTASMDGYFRIWQTANGQQVRRFRGPGSNGYRAAAGTPDGRMAVVADGTHSVHLYDFETGRFVRTFKPAQGHSTDARCAISPDHRKILTAGQVNSMMLNLYDAQTGACERTTDLGAGAPEDLCFSADGDCYMTGWTGAAARLWRTSDGACLREIKIPGVIELRNRISVALKSVALSPDGRLALTGLFDGRIMVWNLENGQCLRTLAGHANEVTDLAFTPDGKYFLSAGKDNLVLLWAAE